jgi:beta-hydroxylase
MEAPYFRIYGGYAGPGPVLYSREECPWLTEVERHWPTIRQEFDEYHYGRGAALTPSYVPDNVEIRGWRSINFVTYAHWYRRNCERFPKTVAILRAIPHLTSAFVNLLEPHSALPVHNGDTNTTYRCHLGLIIPAGGVERCGLQVAGERTGWREGAAFAFNEAFDHFVWNDTDQDRVVLVFDVLKPEYRSRKRWICGAVLGAMTLTMLETKFPPLRRLPSAARRGLHRGLGIAAEASLLLRDGVR